MSPISSGNDCWPVLQGRVHVFGPWHDHWLPTTVEDRIGDVMWMAAPNSPGSIVPVVGKPRQVITLAWVSDRGDAELDCRILDVATKPLATWKLEALGKAVVKQRRNFVRANVRVPLQVTTNLGEESLEGWAVDLSEGGVRIVTAQAEFEEGRRILLEMEIEEELILTPAEVIRHHVDSDGFSVVALKFADLHIRDADRIRRFVFSAQRRTPARRR